MAPDGIDIAIWSRRIDGLGVDDRNAMRQAIGLIWPATLDVTQTQSAPDREVLDSRAERARQVAWLVQRLPEPWRSAAAPLVAVGPSSLEDGPLHEFWQCETIVRRMEALARHLDFCAAAGLPLDVTPQTVRAALTDASAETRLERPLIERPPELPARKQKRIVTPRKLKPMRPGGVAAEMASLLGAVRAIMPARDWNWFIIAERAISKRAKAFGSRNAARIVDVTDLRRAGLMLMEAARIAHADARGVRERSRAHDRAREGLMMILLSESPLRIGSIASVDLQASFVADLTLLVVAARDTKEKRQDVRVLSAVLITALGQYIALHRPVLARPDETALIVDKWGKRADEDDLSTAFTASTKRIFGRPVNAHAVRTSVATWIVATAPQEAALASLILHHRDARTTEAYHSTADQLSASQALSRAADATARQLTPSPPGKRKAPASSRPRRSLRLELAARRGR
ncbi:tyrosine-type recombinase/integrase [Rubrimonas cliftonensis]|uniref:tyrosine-type recombinase/integrase n=1 Tax=Rubrimonas cliftonensis TaxID=89524 RepID=UPI001587DA43|nr:tyrosine-type recombinase/integrase [Rubrimonas cliftonensis]